MTREMLFALALGYLLGSVPFGLVLTRLTGRGDIRAIGSGNIGATNVLRTGSRPLAALTLILDCLKATAAIVLARYLWGEGSGPMAAAGALIGHLYPVWLGFRGGKGAATLFGILIALLPIAAGIYAALWVLLLATSRISSVAGMVAAISAPITAALLSSNSLSNAARFRVAGAVEAPRKYCPPNGGFRARHWEGEGLNEDLIDRLRLARTSGIGPVTFRQLLRRFGGPTEALQAIPELARRGGGRVPAVAGRDDAEREIARVEKFGACFLVLGQELYPRRLAELDDAPPLLVAKGRVSLLDRPSVSMVGARNASAAACRFARGLAHDLGEQGLVVVSGLARGIDSAAHDGSLESGTIAVIAGGIDVAYPPENAERQKAIAEGGLLLAEMPPGTEPRARHFPYRNRIIAGLSAGTVVVEAAPRSGSLITARLAAEAGRDVMAVPGSPLDPRAQGCNQLIRDGATLVQNAHDVVEAIGPLARFGCVRRL